MNGQITIIAIVLTLVTIITFNAVLPILQNTVAQLVNTSTDDFLTNIVQLYPLFLGLGILIAIVTFTTVQRPIE